MPDVVDRLEKERKLSTRILGLWDEWSDVQSPQKLEVPRLKSAARESIFPLLESQFMAGSLAVTNQFNVRQDERRAAIIFLFFFSSWENWFAGSWSSRVENYKADQAKPNPSRPPWRMVKGRGLPFGIVDGSFVEEPVRLDPVDPRKVIGAKPLVAPFDADRMAVGGVTNSNTAGELFGWRESERLGDGRIEAFWRTDVNPCEYCARLEGQPSRIWKQFAPNGPMLHEHCRCWLEFRRVLGTVPIGNMRSHQAFSIDGEKSRKFFTF